MNETTTELLDELDRLADAYGPTSPVGTGDRIREIVAALNDRPMGSKEFGRYVGIQDRYGRVLGDLGVGRSF
jgi:hypothetical protein